MIVLYRKYRPQKIAELAGQENVKEILLSSFKSGKISHAYLFSGPRGSGKTTTARIVAKILNCESNQPVISRQSLVNSHKTKDQRPTTKDKLANDQQPIANSQFNEPCNKCDACLAITEGTFLDVLEIDAASNRGIDDIRDLREKVKLAPGLGRFKVYIIDEAHMLTNEAFNALLKTLEEPPEHVVFILCTTEAKKLPATIISRCQKFEFKKAKKEEIVAYLSRICRAEKINFDKKALEAIAENAQGGFRDAVSLLDQAASFSNDLSYEIVQQTLAFSDEKYALRLLYYLTGYDSKKSLELIQEFLSTGKDPYLFVKDTLSLLEKILLVKNGIIDPDSAGIDPDLTGVETGDLKQLIHGLLKCEEEMKFTFLPQLPLELFILEWCLKNNEPTPKLNDRKKSEITIAEETGPAADSWQESVSEVAELSEGEFKKNWPDILKMVRSFNHSLEALLRSCEIEAYSQNSLVIGVFYQFHKDKLMDIKILRLLNECINKVLGQEIKVTIVLKERKRLLVQSENSGPDLANLASEIFNN